eukprot:Pgem_evm1s11796
MELEIQGFEKGRPVFGKLAGPNRAQTQSAEFLSFSINNSGACENELLTFKQNPHLFGNKENKPGRLAACAWD